MDILARSREIHEEVVANRRHIHRNPELGMYTQETTDFIIEKLEEMGYEPEICGESGVVATVGGKHGGKCMLLRADMDALPMQEESGLAFASQKANMAHTCGHDMHAAMLLGAAKLLKEMEDELAGTVKLAFQPGEEILTGAKAMLEDGLLEDPHVDCVLGQHVIPHYPSGMIRFRTGASEASADMLTIRIQGSATHGASPHKGVDPILVAAYTIIALQEINSREVDPQELCVLTFGTLHSGTKENILPEFAEFRGTLRTYDQGLRNFAKQRIREIAEGVARMYRAEAEVEFTDGCPPLVCDPEVMKTIGKGLVEILGEEHVDPNKERMTGSEDFSFVTDACPVGGFLYVGADDGKHGTPHMLHHPAVYFDENCMVNGVAAYVTAAVYWLKANAEM